MPLVGDSEEARDQGEGVLYSIYYLTFRGHLAGSRKGRWTLACVCQFFLCALGNRVGESFLERMSLLVADWTSFIDNAILSPFHNPSGNFIGPPTIFQSVVAYIP